MIRNFESDVIILDFDWHQDRVDEFWASLAINRNKEQDYEQVLDFDNKCALLNKYHSLKKNFLDPQDRDDAIKISILQPT